MSQYFKYKAFFLAHCCWVNMLSFIVFFCPFCLHLSGSMSVQQSTNLISPSVEFLRKDFILNASDIGIVILNISMNRNKRFIFFFQNTEKCKGD